MELKVDDKVATPFGDATVVVVDHAREQIVVAYDETGLAQTFNEEELEEPDDPPLEDPEALSEWLDRGIQAVIIPSLQVEDFTWRCNAGVGCDCEHCYSIERVYKRPGVHRETTTMTHMLDNQACACVVNGCGCV